MTDECDHNYVPVMNGTMLWCTKCHRYEPLEVSDD